MFLGGGLSFSKNIQGVGEAAACIGLHTGGQRPLQQCSVDSSLLRIFFLLKEPCPRILFDSGKRNV